MRSKLNFNDEPKSLVVKSSEKRNEKPKGVDVKPSNQPIESTPIKLNKQINVIEEKRNK